MILGGPDGEVVVRRVSKTAERRLAVARLERLVRLDSQYADQLNDRGVRLVRAATLAAFSDCLRVGAARQAKRLTGAREPN